MVLPAEQPGVVYSLLPEPDEPPGTYDVSAGDVDVTVTATLEPGYVFADPLPGIWAPGTESGTAVFEETLTQVPESCEVVLPAEVSVSQAVCADGVVPPSATASVVLPAEQPGVVYSLLPEPDEPPGTYDVSAGDVDVTVTATLEPGYVFADPLPGIWAPGTESGTAVFEETLTQVPESCEVVLPAEVSVSQAVCADGVVPPSATASVVLPAEQPGVVYSLLPEPDEPPGTYDVSAGDVDVTVTATLEPGYVFADPLPGIWAPGTESGTAVFEETLTQVPESCEVVLPAEVSVSQAVCADGVVPPSATASVVLPAEQPGVVYSLLPEPDEPPGTYDVSAGDVDVTVTATLEPGYVFADPLPGIWAPGTESGTAVFEETLTQVPESCEVVLPAEVSVSQAVCADGVVPPSATASVVLPAEQPGVVYSLLPEPDEPPGTYDVSAGDVDVTVTATLEPGYVFADPLPGIWAPGTESGTAVFEETLTQVPESCEVVLPAEVSVSQAVCADGVVPPSATASVVLPAEQPGVVYSLLPEPDEPPGTYDVSAGDVDVTVTATLEPGYVFADPLPGIWAPGTESGTAVFEETLTQVPESCEVVLPAEVSVSQAVCADGVVPPSATASVVLPAEQPGVVYSLLPEPDEPPGTYDVSAGDVDVTVTATLEPGYVFADPLPGIWAPGTESGTAVFEETLTQVPESCPDGNSTSSSVPGGSTTAPGGATTAPGGATTAPGGATTVPGGATTVPGGATTVPGGATTVPGGATTVPGGATTAPGGATTVPGGATGARRRPTNGAQRQRRVQSSIRASRCDMDGQQLH